MCRHHRRDSNSGGESCPSSPLPTHDSLTGPGLHDTTDHMQSMAVDNPYSPRRRSVDIGGLSLALNTVSLGDEGTGKGWGGWEESDVEVEDSHYAELLSDMYTQTMNAVNRPVTSPPPQISPETRRRLIRALDSWHFEPHLLSDEEVLACTQLLFEVLFRVEGMSEAIGVSLNQMGSFLVHLRQAYRASNSYHNFQHALDVFQATHMYLRKAGAVPPVSILETDSSVKWRPPPIRNSVVGILRNEDLFALCIAAVGHDVGHPGFNNIFMKNAQAPLSKVYDHKSALERMHCAFLLPIMKRHGLEHLLDRRVDGAHFRKLLLETVLATDMGVHKNFMERFKSLIEQPEQYDVAQARILVCQALIKCADISNPSRPHTVSQHWSAALAAEWAQQALLERQLRLPVSVQDSDDPVTEAKGQISFIQAFVLPLLEITAVAIPEMKCFVEHCSHNCQQWAKRLVELSTQQEPNYPPVPYRPVSPPQPQDFLSIFPLSLPANFQETAFSEERLFRYVGAASTVGDAGGVTMDLDSASASSHSHSHSVSGSGSSFVVTPYDHSRSPSPYTVTSTHTNINGKIHNNISDSHNMETDGVGSMPTAASHQATPRPLPAISTKTSPFATTFSPIDYSVSTTPSTLSSLSPRSECPPHTPGTHSASGSVTSASVSGVTSALASGFGGVAAANFVTANYPGTGGIGANGTFPGVGSATSIRNAIKLGVRKKKSFHHRNSWTPGPSGLSSYAVPLSVPVLPGSPGQMTSTPGSPVPGPRSPGVGTGVGVGASPLGANGNVTTGVIGGIKAETVAANGRENMDV